MNTFILPSGCRRVNRCFTKCMQSFHTAGYKAPSLRSGSPVSSFPSDSLPSKADMDCGQLPQGLVAYRLWELARVNRCAVPLVINNRINTYAHKNFINHIVCCEPYIVCVKITKKGGDTMGCEYRRGCQNRPYCCWRCWDPCCCCWRCYCCPCDGQEAQDDNFLRGDRDMVPQNNTPGTIDYPTGAYNPWPWTGTESPERQPMNPNTWFGGIM